MKPDLYVYEETKVYARKSFGSEVIIALAISYSGYFASFLTSIFIARTLGPEGKGIYSLFLETVFGIVLFSGLGIGNGQIFESMKDRAKLTNFLANGLMFSITISLGAAVLYFFLGWLFRFKIVDALSPNQLLLGAIVVPIISYLIYQRQYLLASQSFVAAKINGALVAIIPFILYVLLYFVAGLTLTGIMLSFTLGQVICLGIYQGVFVKERAFKWKFSTRFAKEAISFGIWQYLGDLSFFLIRRLDFFVVFAILGKNTLGIYSVAVALAEIISRITHEIGTILFPEFMSGRIAQGRGGTILRKTFFIMTIIATCLMAISSFLINAIFGKAFINAVVPFRILIVGTIALSVIDVIWNYAMSAGNPKIGIPIFLAGALLDVVLNLILSPAYGVVGASIAATISYILSATLFLGFFCKREGISPQAALIISFKDISEIVVAAKGIPLVLSRKK